MANVGFENWTAGIDARVRDASEEEQHRATNSIYKVPAYLRKLNPEAYTPQVVSFGPYHHGDKILQLTEVHKEQAVVHFIKRAGQPLENLVKTVRKMVETLREAYFCLDEKWMIDEDAFVKMMILDGCFMYELLLPYACPTWGYSNVHHHFARNSHLRSIIMSNDILLIENQLPVTLLRTLASFEKPKAEKADLTSLINEWAISLGFNREKLKHGDITTYQGSHLLDLCLKFRCKPKHEEETDNNSSSAITNVGEERNTKSSPSKTIVLEEAKSSPSIEIPTKSAPFKTIVREVAKSSRLITIAKSPGLPEETNTNSPSAIPIVRYSAREQHKAGVHFKKSITDYFDDVDFDLQNGTFHLPQLQVGDDTERIFLNMIAFEQLHPRINSKFVYYIWLMDEIIDTADDVSLLCKSGIITNLLGSDEEVALLFNRVAKNVLIDYRTNILTPVREKVSEFCGRRRNMWLANLNHTYFRSPWSIISLVGALLLFLLTITQTSTSFLQLYQK